MGNIGSAEEEDEPDDIPEGFHLQEESPHCLNMNRAEDFQAYLAGRLVLEFERIIRQEEVEHQQIEYGKGDSEFFWAVQGPTSRLFDTQNRMKSASVKDASCRLRKLGECGPDHLNSRELHHREPRMQFQKSS